MTASVRYPSNSNIKKQIKKLGFESEDFPTYNIFKIIASICNVCVSKICEYLPTPSVPTFAKTCKCKPCHCSICIDSLNHIENDRIELRLLYENKSRIELDHDKCKNNDCRPCPAHNCLNIQANSNATYKPWQQMPVKNPIPGSRTIDIKQLSQLGVLGNPVENKYMQDFYKSSVENYPLIIQRKHVDVHDPICDNALYICGRCECKNKSQFEQYLGHNLEPQNQRCTGSSICKCSLCECLSCPLQKEAIFTESVESFKTSDVRNCVENEWNGRLRYNEQEIQACTTAKDTKHFRDSEKIIVSKSSDERYFAKCNKHDHGRKPCNTLQHQRMFSKMPVKEMLDNVYRDAETEDNDKNVSTVSPNNILTDQLLKNKYGVYTTENHETNTENFTAEKCIETDGLSANKKQCVKNYEYTLKIEIITPNFDDNTKQAMKQRIRRTSKNKIKEQTQKVMQDVIKDISKNSLIHDMSVPENANELQLSDNKNLTDMESKERNKTHNILKSIVSVTSTTTEKQDSLQMITALPRKKGSKIEDFIVSCVTPLRNISLNTGKVINANKSEVPSKDESVLSQNYWSPIPPALPSMMRTVDVVEKRISYVDVNKSSTLDDLRVQEPWARRVSHHTVSLKWKLPKLIKEIMGYEILVDGRTIEKILNPKRCLAVVSCLPQVQRVMITIRTLPKKQSLHGIYPSTTIGYQPRANKFIRI